MTYYVCDGLLFDSYALVCAYADEQYQRFGTILGIEKVVKV